MRGRIFGLSGLLAVVAACGSTPAIEQTGAAPSAGDAPMASEAAATTSTPTTAQAEAAACRTSELTVSLKNASGAAGTVYRDLVFTNSGSRSCTMQGFPGVSYVAGQDGHQVGPAAYRDGTKGDPVKLAPKGTAVAPVGFVNVRNYRAAACKPTPVRGLRVYPPHNTESVFVPMDGMGCAGSPPGNQLVVKTVQ